MEALTGTPDAAQTGSIHRDTGSNRLKNIRYQLIYPYLALETYINFIYDSH